MEQKYCIHSRCTNSSTLFDGISMGQLW